MTDPISGQTWVLTGAAGRVATALRSGLCARVARLRLVDVLDTPPRHPNEESIVADLRDQPAMTDAVAGAHGVLHLGALSDEADFRDLTEVNILGTYHVLEAARRGGLRRVVFASSNRLTGHYPAATRVDPSMPPRPDGLYGVSKVAGEALGRLYADKFGLQVVCLRIGSYAEAPRDHRHLSTWLSPADCLSAFLAAMTVPDLTFSVFYGVSNNTRGWWDLSAGHALGYHPLDNAEEHAAAVAAGPAGPTGDDPQGGEFARPAYTLDRQR